MLAFDSSSIIYAWDNYPFKMFPPLWRWLELEIRHHRVVFPYVSKQEIIDNSPECAEWLSDVDPSFISISPTILVKALQFKELLGIVEDKYGKGVCENDLIIIAVAKEYEIGLVSNEKVQTSLPQIKKNYHIPAVCSIPQINVRCLSFLEYLYVANQVFGS